MVVLDLVTIKISIDRTELEENTLAAPVCSRTYPYIKNPKYFIFLTDIKENNVFAFMKTKDEENGKVINTEIKFQAPPTMVGNCCLKVHCICDSYVGLDAFTEMRFTIQKESETRETFSYHEEDIKREPTLFEQALQGFKEDNSDDELSEEEEDSKVQGSFDSKKSQAKVTNSDEEVEESKDD